MTPLFLLQAGFGLLVDPVPFETTQLPILGFVKIMLLLALALYVAFAFVVTRQISVMRRTLITSFSPLIRTLGYIHLVVAFSVFLIFLFLL